MSWEGHGSDPIITTNSDPKGAGGSCTLPELVARESTGALSSSLAVCLSTTGPLPLILGAKEALLAAALCSRVLGRLFKYSRERGGGGAALLGRRTSVQPLIPPALPELYAN